MVADSDHFSTKKLSMNTKQRKTTTKLHQKKETCTYASHRPAFPTWLWGATWAPAPDSAVGGTAASW